VGMHAMRRRGPWHGVLVTPRANEKRARCRAAVLPFLSARLAGSALYMLVARAAAIDLRVALNCSIQAIQALVRSACAHDPGRRCRCRPVANECPVVARALQLQLHVPRDGQTR
jgi:hypothetical protein